ncbi:MAG: hypothetical protein K2K75_06235 [Muribaculaceae bacterium]|nr:hypothetical protein [Muribaculaceae bacterium]
MSASDSLRHALEKKKRAALWSAFTPMELDDNPMQIDASDTRIGADHSRNLMPRKAGSVDEQIFMDSTVSYRAGNMPESKTVYSYDSEGRKVSEIVYYGDGYDWKPYSKNEKVYNENGRSLLDAFWYWDDEMCWIGSSKHEYDYDENGTRILDAYYSGWDSAINDWRGSYRNEDKYDSSGNCVMSIYMSGWNYDTHSFNSGTKTEYTFNQNGYKIESLASEWYSEKNDFVLKYKQEFDYDERGNCILEAEYNYNIESDSWIGVYKYEYAYKNSNRYLRILKAYYNGWNNENGEWIGYDKYDYDFDSYGNKILDSYSKWDDSAGDWIEMNRTEKVFEENSSRQTDLSYFIWDSEINMLRGIEHWTTLYNDHGDIMQHIVFSWDEEAKDWSIKEKYNYAFDYDDYGRVISSSTSVNDIFTVKTDCEYDDRGNLIGSVSYEWTGEDWINYCKFSRQYDDYNRMILELTYISANDGSWINETKQELGYREDYYYYNDPILHVEYKWNVEREDWDGVQKYEYAYDSNGRNLSYFRYVAWNLSLGWIGEQGYEYTYNDDGKKTKYTVYYNWNLENNCWADATREEYTYNSDGNNILTMASVWNSDSQNWSEQYKTVTEYNESGYKTAQEDWTYDASAEKWIGSYKYEYDYDERGYPTINARYSGWDFDGDCWRGSYKYEYAYDENGNTVLDAYYNGWDNTNHCWKGSRKSEFIRDEKEDGYVVQEVKSQWDTGIPDWRRTQKIENGYICVNDTIYYSDESFYVNKSTYQSYRAFYYASDGESWIADSKTECLYDETMRLITELYYGGNASDVEWLCQAKREYEFDVYGNICLDNYSVYDNDNDAWTPDYTTRYYYTKGINVLDEDEWLNLKNVYAELSKREGWKKQWYDCSSINSAYSWSGVTRSDGHVTGVDISGFNLSGSFPYYLFSLPYLKEINISNNKFEGDLTTEFADSIEAINGSAENVTSLYMANNNFEGNASALIPYFPSLTSLNLSGNKFESVDPMLPASIKSLNIRKQRSDKVIDMHLSSVDVDDMINKLPDIWYYDHEDQSFSTWRNLIVTEGNANSFSWGDGNFSLLLSEEDGKVTLSRVSSYNKEYHGENGGTMSVICNSGDAEGSTLKVRFNFDEGDANFINGVDASDLQATILYIFGNYSSYPFNYTAADTHKDDVINVQDVVCTVNILLAQTPDTGNSQMRVSSHDSNDISVDASVYIENGQVILNSTRPVAAIDLKVAGQVMWDVQRFGLQQTVDGGNIVGYSLSGATLPVGAIVIGEVVGDAQIVGASLSDYQAQALSVSFDKNAVTGVSDVQSETDDNSEVYDLNGRRIKKAVNGINIIRNANGGKKIISRHAD